MDWHARMIRGVIGPVWARWEQSPYLRVYRKLCTTQFDDRRMIRTRQWNAVRALVQHAYATVPFYKERLDAHGIHPGEITNFDDYRRIPVLTKADIRAGGKALLSDRF